ncbi:hypothetical protein [Mesorhizobium sp.]|uniref:hypothetical protein n=1 Tax=Mesorhizobium sp. TaxID=1871066 RepID=UPI00120822B8|nr:hypothetical protein [Mesorhizobium sp.]TIL38521.1 MAG: hypothetical protein E5Y82_13545 [Mesorhizobium sp.]
MYKALIGSACAAVILVSGVHLYDRHAAAEVVKATKIAALCTRARERLASADATDEDRSAFIACGLRDVIAAGKAASFEPVVQSAQEINIASDLKDSW